MADPRQAPLACPACRTSLPADRLVCPADDCGATWPTVGDAIPLLAPTESLSVIRGFDLEVDLDAPIAPWLSTLERGGDTWQRVAVAGMYLRSHYYDRESPFAPLAEWALGECDGGAIETALDLGCGPGRLSFELARHTPACVTGLDFNPFVLRWAERIGRDDRLEYPCLWSELRFSLETLDVGWTVPLRERVRWICADGISPPFPKDSFDLVCAISYLDNSRDPLAALAQAAALAKPGGHLLIATPDSWNSAATPVAEWVADCPEVWKRLLESCGLDVVAEVDGIPWTLPRTHRHAYFYRLWAVLARKRRAASAGGSGPISPPASSRA